MTTKSRLDKTITGIKEIVELHNLQNKFEISEDKIIIRTGSPGLLATILFLLILFLFPVGLLIYYLIIDISDPVILWLLLFEIIFCSSFYILMRDNTILTINFKDKYFKTDNYTTVLKKIYPSKKVSFIDIIKTGLKKRSFTRGVESLELFVVNKEKKKIALTSFNNTYSESVVAEEIKFLIEVIIWTENQSWNSPNK